MLKQTTLQEHFLTKQGNNWARVVSATILRGILCNLPSTVAAELTSERVPTLCIAVFVALEIAIGVIDSDFGFIQRVYDASYTRARTATI